MNSHFELTSAFLNIFCKCFCKVCSLIPRASDISEISSNVSRCFIISVSIPVFKSVPLEKVMAMEHEMYYAVRKRRGMCK